MSSLPKPVLRGHIQRRGVKAIIGGLCFAAMNGVLFHFFVSAPRKRAIEEAARTYDAEAHYKDLMKWGYYSLQEIMSEKGS